MQLHQIQPQNKSRKQPRIGRGGRRGTYSGRGQKGQRSRAGHKIKPAVYDLIGRLPKLRGYKNKSAFPKNIAVKLGDLAKLEIPIIDKDFFRKKGILRPKIVANGKITKPLRVKGVPVSQAAKKEIEAAGGRVE